MGVEDFEVTLASEEDVEQALARRAVIRARPWEHPVPGWKYFLYDDGAHFIELMLRARHHEAGVMLDCSFAVCHPSSIDACFARLVVELAQELGAVLTIREEAVDGDPFEFGPSELGRVPEVLERAIHLKRQARQADFGKEQAKMTSAEALRHFVVDRFVDDKRT